MITGKDVWNREVTQGLTEYRFRGQTREFYFGVPENLFCALERTAEKSPDKVFIIDEENGRFTFSKLLEDTRKLAGWLAAEKGIGQGDHVGMMLHNSYAFCVLFLALNRLGAPAVLYSTKLRRQEVDSLLQKTALKLMLCEAQFDEWFAQESQVQTCEFSNEQLGTILSGRSYPLAPPLPSDDLAALPATILFTSGTTAKSKAAVLRNYNIMHAVAVYQRTLGITQEDKTIVPVPLFYVTGLVAIFGLFLYTGGTLYIHRFFDAEHVLKTAAEENITFFHASPTVFTMMLRFRTQYPSLPAMTRLACGSSNMPPQTLQKIHDWLPHMAFHTIYGLTETSSPACVFPGDAAESPFIGSSGLPVPGVSVQIVDDEGNELPCHEVGVIRLRGTVVIEQYYMQESDAFHDGWLDTGDLGYLTPQGYLYIVDRKKDMINRGGEKVCSYDVENELLKIDGVMQAAVVAIPHALYGEAPAAAIRLEAGKNISAEQIQALLKTKIASYKIPEKIIFPDELPLTRNLKIDKKAIQRLLSEDQGGTI